MATYDHILQAIGTTPLVKLNSITKNIASTIYAKVEYLNPGGSTKDRIALTMVEAAEKAGLLQPGGTIIEATAGNTGVGLALIAAVKKYRCIFVMPDKMSQDKINLLKAYGAEVVVTPTSVPPDSPESYNGVAERLAKEIPGAYRPNQFENPHNPLAHYLTTGPEIWADSAGKIDVFVASMGTGGTISGVAKYLKEQNPNIIIVGADPEGSILSGDSPKSYKVEGIGEDFIPKTFNRQLVDEMVRVNDKESFNMARCLAREEGLLVGGSCGTAVAAALKYAARLTEPKYIVALLPDTGRNYINKIYSDTWMQENGFWEGTKTRTIKVGEILSQKTDFPSIVAVAPRDTLSTATNLLQKLNISQLPVIDNNQVLGSLNEASLMKCLHDGINFSNQEVFAVMGKPLPLLDEEVDISEAYRVLLSGTTGIIITSHDIPIGLITRADLIKYWINQTHE
ncbi:MULTISPECIES: cystathionine beta-synthase [Nostocales]|uniref:Cystathionine beta-synthase n=1 Tax=Dolichospermum flos-aquae UHCC 0037 TaxID=2590026 RepID=A0ACC7SAN6_DOLFA|nr:MULTISPECIES: cystathionine beta-synthase [Nostocales]MBO1063267.1 cystathionine beta-synthase [Anabaena sp. 54]MTJ45592.1 cystathionine beta-synthase [Dolichospermum flos-aquae UHCC 0037]